MRYFGGVGLGIPPIYDIRFLRGIHYLIMQQSPSEASDDKFRSIARKLLEQKYGNIPNMESVVRRVVRKFAMNGEDVESASSGENVMPETLEGMAIKEIELLLHSVGVPTANPIFVNVEVDLPSYSDLDEEIP